MPEPAFAERPRAAEAASGAVTAERPGPGASGAWADVSLSESAQAGRLFALEGEFDRDVHAVVDELDSLVYTEFTEDAVIRILFRWSGESVRPAGAPTGYWLDRLFTELSRLKTTTGLFRRDTTYYDQIFDHFDRVDEVRLLRDHGAPLFRGRDSVQQMKERREEAEKRQQEEIEALAAEAPGEFRENVARRVQAVPRNPESLAKARAVASRFRDVPDSKLSPQARMLSQRIGVEGPEVLLEGVHFVTQEERDRWKKALAQTIVITMLEFAALYVGGEVLAMVAPDFFAALVGAEIETGAAPLTTEELLAGGRAAETTTPPRVPTLRPNMPPASEFDVPPARGQTGGGGGGGVVRSTVEQPTPGGGVSVREQLSWQPAEGVAPRAAPEAPRPVSEGALTKHPDFAPMPAVEGQEVTRAQLAAEQAATTPPPKLYAPGAAPPQARAYLPGAAAATGPHIAPAPSLPDAAEGTLRLPGTDAGDEEIGDPKQLDEVLEASPTLRARPQVKRMTREIAAMYRGIPIYLDPRTNTWKNRWGQIQPDHFIPVRYILDVIVGSKAPLLTDEQLTALLTYEGNFQALPAPLNYSKAGILPSAWPTYKGKPIDPGYRTESKKYEAIIIRELTDMMDGFLRANALEKKK